MAANTLVQLPFDTVQRIGNDRTDHIIENGNLSSVYIRNTIDVLSNVDPDINIVKRSVENQCQYYNEISLNKNS